MGADTAQLGGPVSALPNGLPRDQTVEALAVTAGAEARAYAYCFGGDLYSSGDGGRSWTLLNMALRSPG